MCKVLDQPVDNKLIDMHDTNNCEKYNLMSIQKHMVNFLLLRWIVTFPRLESREVTIRFPAYSRDYLFLSKKRPNRPWGSHHLPFQRVTGALSLWVKLPTREAHYWNISLASIKNQESYNLSPTYAFMQCTRIIFLLPHLTLLTLFTNFFRHYKQITNKH